MFDVNVIQRQGRVEDQNEAEGYMSEQTFQDAYARVRGYHSDQAWFSLSPREITDSIYREIRSIDRERGMAAKADFVPMAVAAE